MIFSKIIFYGLGSGGAAGLHWNADVQRLQDQGAKMSSLAQPPLERAHSLPTTLKSQPPQKQISELRELRTKWINWVHGKGDDLDFPTFVKDQEKVAAFFRDGTNDSNDLASFGFAHDVLAQNRKQYQQFAEKGENQCQGDDWKNMKRADVHTHLGGGIAKAVFLDFMIHLHDKHQDTVVYCTDPNGTMVDCADDKAGTPPTPVTVKEMPMLSKLHGEWLTAKQKEEDQRGQIVTQNLADNDQRLFPESFQNKDVRFKERPLMCHCMTTAAARWERAFKTSQRTGYQAKHGPESVKERSKTLVAVSLFVDELFKKAAGQPPTFRQVFQNHQEDRQMILALMTDVDQLQVKCDANKKIQAMYKRFFFFNTHASDSLEHFAGNLRQILLSKFGFGAKKSQANYFEQDQNSFEHGVAHYFFSWMLKRYPNDHFAFMLSTKKAKELPHVPTPSDKTENGKRMRWRFQVAKVSRVMNSANTDTFYNEQIYKVFENAHNQKDENPAAWNTLVTQSALDLVDDESLSWENPKSLQVIAEEYGTDQDPGFFHPKKCAWQVAKPTDFELESPLARESSPCDSPAHVVELKDIDFETPSSTTQQKITNLEDICSNIYNDVGCSKTTDPQGKEDPQGKLRKTLFENPWWNTKVSKPNERGGIDPKSGKVEPPHSYHMFHAAQTMRKVNQKFINRDQSLTPLGISGHAGEVGYVQKKTGENGKDVETIFPGLSHLATGFLLSEYVSHGVDLSLTSTGRLMYYLEKIPLNTAPVSNLELFWDPQEQPLQSMVEEGLQVTISSDDALIFPEFDVLNEDESYLEREYVCATSHNCVPLKRATSLKGFSRVLTESDIKPFILENGQQYKAIKEEIEEFFARKMEVPEKKILTELLKKRTIRKPGHEWSKECKTMIASEIFVKGSDLRKCSGTQKSQRRGSLIDSIKRKLSNPQPPDANSLALASLEEDTLYYIHVVPTLDNPDTIYFDPWKPENELTREHLLRFTQIEKFNAVDQQYLSMRNKIEKAIDRKLTDGEKQILKNLLLDPARTQTNTHTVVNHTVEQKHLSWETDRSNFNTVSKCALQELAHRSMDIFTKNQQTEYQVQTDKIEGYLEQAMAFRESRHEDVSQLISNFKNEKSGP